MEALYQCANAIPDFVDLMANQLSQCLGNTNKTLHANNSCENQVAQY